jgi:hypothetical protein
MVHSSFLSSLLLTKVIQNHRTGSKYSSKYSSHLLWSLRDSLRKTSFRLSSARREVSKIILRNFEEYGNTDELKLGLIDWIPDQRVLRSLEKGVVGG